MIPKFLTKEEICLGENSKTILDKNIVEEWLREIHSICLNEENVTVNNRPWRGKVNKTLAYMTENNLRKDDLIPIILKLGVQNYSYTQEDRNSNFAGEKFWFFGITETMVDCQENLYIKLKVRELNGKKLLIMFFHPETHIDDEYQLTYPYR